MIPLTARVRVLRVHHLPRGFQKGASFSFTGDATGRNLLDSEIFEAVAENYDISPDPKDYSFLVARALTADVPNSNGDLFPLDELRRFDLVSGKQVYRTFENKPIHVNHAAENPKLARGFIPDVHLNTDDPNDVYVEALVALDRTKYNDGLVADYEEGRRDSFSMGCLAAKVECSICAKVATAEHEMCNHLRFQKMQKVGGRLVYEACYGVTYTELSCVDDPADKTATTQAMLGKLAASRRLPMGEKFRMAASASTAETPRLIESLGLSKNEMQNVADFYRDHLNQLPAGMARLGSILFRSA